MFESLSGRLSGVFDKLTKQGALSDADVEFLQTVQGVAFIEQNHFVDLFDYVVEQQVESR